MGIWNSLSNIFSSDNTKGSSRSSFGFSGKNKKAVSDGLRNGSKECGRLMRQWRDKKK